MSYYKVTVTAQGHFFITADTPEQAQEKIKNLGPIYHGWKIVEVHPPKNLSTKEYREMMA